LLYQKRVYSVLVLGIIAFAILPWYRIEEGFYSFSWLGSFLGQGDLQPGLMQVFSQGRWWLFIPFVLLLLGFPIMLLKPVERTARLILILGIIGFLFIAIQSFAVGFLGWSYDFLENTFGSLSQGQPALGAGAIAGGTC